MRLKCFWVKNMRKRGALMPRPNVGNPLHALFTGRTWTEINIQCNKCPYIVLLFIIYSITIRKPAKERYNVFGIVFRRVARLIEPVCLPKETFRRVILKPANIL
ncbi:unnamed protein product [Macrosiphum euphorbiae]|uniref:Uncharacterized protein n=1 Tax=Macrosiphum euphorbiae TaxID=13131 RepID=A0AAV0WZ05_9HEMI|nr:unnamed protein product [Macrosiphum euphorbiae]